MEEHVVERKGLAEGLVALVTGAGSGIGRETARLFALEGARGVVVSDVDADHAEETVDLIREAGHEAVAVPADVSDDEQVQSLVDGIVNRYGRLDCAVNNAGVRGRMSPLADYDHAVWHHVIGVNLTGVYYCVRAEINAMKAAGGGAIVNISSGTTADPTPHLGAYVASKFGVLGLTRVAAGETAADNIRVNAVLPGSTRTAMYDDYLATDPDAEHRIISSMPQGRFGTPAELAEAIIWLCSPRASFVTGISMLVDGGMHSFSTRPRPQQGEGDATTQ